MSVHGASASPRRGPGLPALLALALALAYLAMSLWSLGDTATAGGPSSRCTDYSMFYSGAVWARAGMDSYDPALPAVPGVSARCRADPLFAYVSPPPLTALLLPFASLPLARGAALWSLCMLLAMVAGLSCMARGPARPLLVGACCALSPEALYTYHLGQCDGLLALGAGLGRAWGARAPARAGLGASLAFCKPHLAPFLWVAVAPGPGGRVRFSLGLACGAALQFLLSCALLPGGARQWGLWVGRLARQSGALGRQNGLGSLAGIARLLPPGLPQRLAFLALGGSLLVALFRLRALASALGPIRALVASLCFLGILAPYVHPYDLVLLLPPLATLVSAGEPGLWGLCILLAWIGTPHLERLGLGLGLTCLPLLPALAVALRPVAPRLAALPARARRLLSPPASPGGMLRTRRGG